MPITSPSDLQPILDKLRIPPELLKPEQLSVDDEARLQQWKTDSETALSALRNSLGGLKVSDVEEAAAIVFAVVSISGEGAWVTENIKTLVHEILHEHITPSVPVLERILSYHIKPIFKPTPHPMLNPDTARKLPRALGGPLAQLDHFEGQVWKKHLGIDNVLLWCVSNMETSGYERMWHLLIPPIMILLDDFDVRYRIQGAKIVSNLVESVPPELLKRTGVDVLLLTSMKTAMTYLHNPLTPTLIREVVPTWVALTELTTPAGSAARFDQHCALLGDTIVGSVWAYGSHDQDTIQASIDTLPVVLKALNIGIARYLKAIIPQLVYTLSAKPENNASIELQIASLRALRMTIEECAPRMEGWKAAIMSNVAQRWVVLKDSGSGNEDVRLLEKELKDVTQLLLKVCPSLAQDELRVLLETDRRLFEPLIQTENDSLNKDALT